MPKSCFQCKRLCEEPSTREMSKYASFHRGRCYYCGGKLSKPLSDEDSAIWGIESQLTKEEVRFSRKLAGKVAKKVIDSGQLSESQRKWWQFWK